MVLVSFTDPADPDSGFGGVRNIKNENKTLKSRNVFCLLRCAIVLSLLDCCA